MRKNILLLFGFLAALILFQNFGTPEFPVRNIETRTLKMNEDGKFETILPHIPAIDMSLDGRIALRRNADFPNIPLYVLTPEKVKHHLQHGQNSKVGANMLNGSPHNFNLDKTLKTNGFPKKLKGYKMGRTFLCEKTRSFKNPSICNGGQSDCYRITFVARYSKPDRLRLASVDLKIQVNNPKTKDAYIAKVDVIGVSRKLGDPLMVGKFSEPLIVGDGRLLISRVGNGETSTDPNATLTTTSGKTGNGINIVYSVYNKLNGKGKLTPQCDVQGWKKLYPISHAYWHQDSKGNPTYMRKRYKFARYQLRDGIGRLVPDGKTLGGSYPWMDKDAANLFFTSYGRDNYYHLQSDGSVSGAFREHQEKSGYKRPSSVSEIEEFEHASARTAGVSIAGLWTYGKTVQLDGRVNNADYNFRISNKNLPGEDLSRRLKLYQTLEGMRPFERIGFVREQGPGTLRSMYHANLATNSSFLGSIENRFNYVDTLKPITPRDIVWHFGTTRHMEEVTFDDFINPYVLINAEMTGAVGFETNKGSMRHFDGILRGKEYTPQNFSGFPTNPSGHPVLFQNANADFTSFLNTPKYGKTIGNVRLEPIAKGGIHGKGVWLQRDQGIQFKVPTQKGTSFSLASNRNFYVGVFVDPREANSPSGQPYQTLIEFGADKRIALKKTVSGEDVAFNRVLLMQGEDVLSRFILPQALRLYYDHWNHIAINFQENQNPELLIDGFVVGAFEPSGISNDVELQNFFRLKAGDQITLGSVDSNENYGIRGWFDDFKIVANETVPEEQCNYARGTIVKLPNTGTFWDNISKNFSDLAQRRISSLANQPEGSRFACFVQYGNKRMRTLEPVHREVFASLNQLPKDSESVRHELTHDNKSLKFGKPRPSFVNTKFCLSCHIPANGKTFAEMDIRALTRDRATNAEDDKRRQPLQPEPFISGVIPKDYFGDGKPGKTLRTNQRHKIDRWVLEH